MMIISREQASYNKRVEMGISASDAILLHIYSDYFAVFLI